MLTQPPETGQIRGDAVDDPKIDRATFLRLGWRRLLDSAAEGANVAMDLVNERLSISLLRPPGALPEAEFLLSCTRCNGCVEACPHDAIVKAPAQAGAAAGTPHILPANLPCYMCEDLPCIQSCADGALLPLASRREVRMGLAVLSPRRCLAVAGDACDICIQCCPFPGEALRANRAGHPQIDPAHCTGCGICVQVCPTQPRALSVSPINGNPQACP